MGAKRPGSRNGTTRLNFRGETTRGETTRGGGGGGNGLGAKRFVTSKGNPGTVLGFT